MNNQRTIFNRYQTLVMAGGIIVGMILIRVLGNSMPLVSTGWLSLCLFLCLVLYGRGRREWLKTQDELEKQKSENSTENASPDLLVRSLNSSIDKQVSALRTLHDISDQDLAIIEKVQNATNDDRLDLYLQPIVDIKDRKSLYYEAFSRLRDENGAILRPADYLDAVEKANRIGFIDNMILLRSVQAVRALKQSDSSATVFCNISPATLYDQNFFSLFTQYLDANSDLSGNLVFEFTYPAITLVDPTIGKSLEAISERGFAFSIDHVQRFDMSLSGLKRLNIRYVKAPISLLQSVDQNGEGVQEQFAQFKNELAGANIELIAEKVEQEIQLQQIEALDITLGQGNLFGLPLPAQSYIKTQQLRQAS